MSNAGILELMKASVSARWLVCLGLLLGCGSRQNSAASAAPVACTPTRELLKNGGFESGSFEGFEFISGRGTVVEKVSSAATCRQSSAAATPRRGRYAFSAAAQDGARAQRSEIGLQQVLSVKDLGLSPGDYVSGSAFASGSCDANGDSAGQLVIGFNRGGRDGQQLDQLWTEAVDPAGGAWQQLITPANPVPPDADTIVFTYRSASSYDKPVIELWADDLSLAVCGAGAELEAWRPVEPTTPGAPDVVAVVPPAEEPATSETSPASPLQPSAQTADVALQAVSVVAERSGCIEETPGGVALKDGGCAHELTAAIPRGDYELTYSVRQWTGQYGIWLAKEASGAGEPGTRIGFDLTSGINATSRGKSLPVQQPTWSSVSARIRLVRVGERLLLYVNEQLVFAKPVERTERRVGFWNRGGSPRVTGLALRALQQEEAANYRSAPETPTQVYLDEQKNAPKASKERSFAWSARLTFDLGDNHGASFKEGEKFTKDGFQLFHTRLEVARMRRLVGPLYYTYGLTAGYFSGKSSLCDGAVVCTTPEKCTCQQDGTRWSTRGFSYGATAALALPGLGSNGSGAILWFPMLRATHVLTKPVSLHCDDSGLCPTADWSFASGGFELGAGADWIYRGLGGCGPRVTLGYYFGDLASRQDLGLVVTLGISFHAESMAL